MRTILILLIATMAGCAPVQPGGSSPIADQDYVLSTLADDNQNAFLIELRSTSNRDLCIDTMDWPNADGFWAGRSGLFELRNSGTTRSTSDVDSGSCTGARCVMRIQRGRSISSRLNYSTFGSNDEIRAMAPKRLNYNLVPSFC